MQEENFAIRLKLLIEKLGIPDSRFADACGISRPTLSLILSGRNKKLSDVVIGQIHEAYPDVSIMWLLFGEGEMFASAAGHVRTEEGSSDNAEDVVRKNAEEFFLPEDSAAMARTEEAPPYGNPRRIENPENAYGWQGEATDLKEKGLNSLLCDIQNTIEKTVAHCLKNAISEIEIAKSTQNRRKVAKITVYYDDSTFETFLPGE